jgi:hypothetical protein
VAWKISRTFYDHDFPVFSLQDKITVFEDRVVGWLLEPAGQVVEEIPHAGFAVLLVLVSYFEMVAKFAEGFCKKGESKTHFRKGLRWVFDDKGFSDEECDLVYWELRNGLYHAGIAGPSVRLSRDFPEPLSCNKSGNGVMVDVNPHTLPRKLEAHFVSYVKRLRDPSEVSLRANFEKRFDWQGTPKRKSTKY